MLIIHGTTPVHRNRGLAVIFCVVCRDAALCKFRELQNFGHLYFIPITPGEIVAQELTCTKCRTLFVFAPQPRTRIRKTLTSLDEALSNLTPEERERLAERLEIEANALEGNVSSQMRRGLLREPIDTLQYSFDQAVKSGSRASKLSLLQFGVIASAGVALWAWMNHVQSTTGRTLAIALGATLFFLLTASIAWRYYSRGSAVVARRTFVPLLARALAPLRPTVHEIKDVLSHDSRDGDSLRELVRPDDLVTAMHAQIP